MSEPVDGKALVREYLEDVFTNGNVDAMDRYLAGDEFKAGVADLVRRWRTAFSDFRIVVDRAVAEGDRVVTVELLNGTHDGVYQSTLANHCRRIAAMAPSRGLANWIAAFCGAMRARVADWTGLMERQTTSRRRDSSGAPGRPARVLAPRDAGVALLHVHGWRLARWPPDP